MINYVEKGIALHEAIVKAGHWLREENNEWVCSDETAVQAIIDSFDGVAAAITAKKLELDLYAMKLCDKAVAIYSKGQIGKWEAKYSQALKYNISKNTSDAPDLQLEATTRGVDIQNIVDRVVANGVAFSNLESVIAGNAGKHKDNVAKLTDLDTIVNYDYSQGWPL